VHEILRELRQALDGYDDRVAVGEVGSPTRLGWACYYRATATSCTWSSASRSGSSRSRRWRYRGTDRGDRDAAAQKRGGPAYACLTNDLSACHQSADGPGDFVARARVVATLLLTFAWHPVPVLRRGVGMTDRSRPPSSAADLDGRDGCRTPMQSGPATPVLVSPPGGPWLPIPATAATVNVADQLTDPRLVAELLPTV